MNAEKNRILIVDDNRMNRIKLSKSVEQEGYQVGLAEGGQQALEILRKEAYDVALLDIMMPGMDGYQVLEHMKADPDLRDIPVIVISALDEIDSIVRCLEMGAEDYLPKSYNPVILRARLTGSLQKKNLRDLEKMFLQQEVTLRQNEKLATLGRLSAGMAHELNNPAAAAQRGAAQLMDYLPRLQESQLKLNQLELSANQLETVLDLEKLTSQRVNKSEYLEILARSDRENELEEWLEEKGLENAWEIAPNLASLGYTPGELDEKTAGLGPIQFATVMDWLDCTAVIYSLMEEIHQGTRRISELVKALKNYTYLDQAPLQSVDLHEGLENTLIILRSKLSNGTRVLRDYEHELPMIEAYGSELNQVWTNLIDNAIDAVEGNGEITLRTRHDDEWAIVEIEDTGPGIPEEIQKHIFDPFFTTKEPGKGSGLGLNITHNIIVQKHKGRVEVNSNPGRTCFEVRLPLHPNHSQDGKKELEKN